MKYLIILLLLFTGCRSAELVSTNDMQQTDSCGVIGSSYLTTGRISLPTEGLTSRQQLRLSKQLISHEYKYLRDSVRISYKTIYDTVRLKEQTIREVKEINTKQTVAEKRIDESWKKWLIIVAAIWLFCTVFALIILKRLHIL